MCQYFSLSKQVICQFQWNYVFDGMLKIWALQHINQFSIFMSMFQHREVRKMRKMSVFSSSIETLKNFLC